MNLETASENVGTMDESLEYATFPDQLNEEYVEAEVITEGYSGYPEDMDVDASAHTEVPEDMDAYTISHPEVPVYH